jgi:Flp pilus assembly pilin Flp
MIQKLRNFLCHESGSASIEFVLIFPIFFGILVSAIDVGMITYRSAMLERGVDITVRDIRLSTGAIISHNDLREDICDNISVIPDCLNSLKIEMQQVDPRAWHTPLSDTVVCTNKAEEIQPVTTFQNGLDNELMVLRVCVKLKTMFTSVGISQYVSRDEAGEIAITALAAFVQEPR